MKPENLKKYMLTVVIIGGVLVLGMTALLIFMVLNK
jgi:hypothetical protein